MGPSSPETSLFDPLLAEGLTSLFVRHDWRSGQTSAVAAREWSPELDFARYRRDFDHETRLTPEPRVLDAKATAALYARHGATEALADLNGLLSAGRHQGVDLWVHRGVRFISNMHSNVLGVANGRHAIRAGGIRRHEPDEPEHEVLVDGLNLSRAMSYKNAAAQIPYGGSKICVVSEPVALDDLGALGFLAWCLDRARCFTGSDMGFTPEHADVLRAHFTRNIVGGPGGALGPTGAPTARGVLRALHEAVRHALERELAGLSVAVQGLGAVGEPLARALLAEGCRVLVSEPDAARLEAFLAQGGAGVEVVDPAEILFAEVDVVSPNAVGGVLGPEEIERLRCRVVMGAANNQLVAVSQQEELRLAERLHARGVLYQIDWMHNTAGVIAGCEEWARQEEASMARVERDLERVCGEGVRQNLEAAARSGRTPTATAYANIEQRLYPNPNGADD